MSDEDVHDALADELARLTGNAKFTVVEFGATGATFWRVYRDRNGTPQAAEQPSAGSSVMADPDAFCREVDPAFIARSSSMLPDELGDLLPLPGAAGVPAYDCTSSLESLLREEIRNSPLTLGYELAVLRQVPAGRSGAGRLYLSGYQLFPPGVRQGHPVRVRVRCEPTDDDGTVFAVVTREHRPDVPPASRQLQPVHIQSAVVAPGTYELTAVLARPGRVRFDGLPGPLRRCDRSWDDLRRLVPERLITREPVHLVCLIELCGGDERLRPRIDRLKKLIEAAETGAGQLLVSVIGYGPHTVTWAMADEPVAVRAWAAPSAAAIAGLHGLLGREVDEREYQRAAQLECALETVTRHLSDGDGRPVIVTAGGRPPHPHEMDTETQLIPCPERVNWRSQLSRLAEPGTAFGALRDPDASGRIWRVLGRDGAATVDDAVDMESFAAGLGLREAAQIVPFPFID